MHAPEQLVGEERAVLEDPGAGLYFSAASAWEILAKAAKGKLTLGEGNQADLLRRHLSEFGPVVLPIRIDHLYAAYRLPPIHKDPIDRC